MRNALFPERSSREIERELAFHVAERTDELIAGGMGPEAAAREATRRFGNRTLQGERTRDVDLVVWLESIGADVRHALRALARSPAFTAVALLSLALGIGANTAIFSLTNALLLKTLPVLEPGRLVQVRMRSPGPNAGDGAAELTNPLWEQIRDHATAVSPSIRLDVTTMADQLSSSVARPRVLAMLSGFFGALALLLAVIGLYGTMAYSVTRRRGEIGVRMALGAASAGVQRMVLGEAARLVVVGAVVGLMLALAATRVLRSFLFALTPTDPGTLAAAVVMLALAAGAAAWLPARRAARMQPMEALRED